VYDLELHILKHHVMEEEGDSSCLCISGKLHLKDGMIFWKLPCQKYTAKQEGTEKSKGNN